MLSEKIIIDLMTDEQKQALAQAMTDKLLDGIQSIEFSKAKKVDLTGLCKSEIEAWFNNGDIYENVDFNTLGNVLTGVVIKAIQENKGI